MAYYKIQYYTPTSHIIRERGIEGSEDEDLSHPATMYFMRFGFLGTQRQLPQNENFPFFVRTHTLLTFLIKKAFCYKNTSGVNCISSKKMILHRVVVVVQEALLYDCSHTGARGASVHSAF